MMEATSEIIKRELLGWKGVSLHQHRFGGIEFRVNGREMGHVHGDRLADLPFPVNVRKELVAAGKASPHHIYPNSGWTSYWIQGSDDVAAVIELFRLQYDRMAKK